MCCDVISEGVESDNQLDVLQSYSCDLLQGFLWSKPLSLEQAQLLTRQEPETLSAS